MSDSFREFFRGLGDRVDSRKIVGMAATYQFVGAGDGGGEYYVRIVNGVVEVGEGRAENPSIELIASAADWVAIMTKQMNGQMAFLTGKLKIKGDIALALKLESIFGLG